MTSQVNLSPHGVWHVTTEGDCEGRSTKDLEVHEGYIDDIAFALAGAAYYKLKFKPVDVKALSRKPCLGTEVHVSLSIESKTWGTKDFERLLSGRGVAVEHSDYYDSVKLIRGADPMRQEQARRDALRNAALSKLSADEAEALGLTAALELTVPVHAKDDHRPLTNDEIISIRDTLLTKDNIAPLSYDEIISIRDTLLTKGNIVPLSVHDQNLFRDCDIALGVVRCQPETRAEARARISRRVTAS
jgi:hypothetical protein